MNYVLIKQPWIELIQRQPWFRNECVPYPVGEDGPAFLVGAYFVPEYRLQEHEHFARIFLGAYETYEFAKLQYHNDCKLELELVGR